MSQNRLTRTEIVERDHGKCYICGQQIDLTLKAPHPLSLTIDHIVPLNRGGPTSSKNLAASHKICNETKTNYDPGEYFTGKEGLLFRSGQRTGLLLITESDEDLYYILKKLRSTRLKWLKKLINEIAIYINTA